MHYAQTYSHPHTHLHTIQTHTHTQSIALFCFHAYSSEIIERENTLENFGKYDTIDIFCARSCC